MVEADLAATYTGVDADLRNLYRPGSGLTPRRLWLLVRSLPVESLTHSTVARERERALTGPDRQRERMAYYANKGAAVGD